MKKLTLLIVCIFITVNCKTVKEEEKKEENQNVIHYESFQKTFEVDFKGDTTWSFEGDRHEIIKHILGDDYVLNQNQDCKESITVFPNPTSSSVTINRGNSGLHYMDFRYKLIFDEKIIYEDFVPGGKTLHTVIPENLLKQEGVYVIAYELHFMGGVLFCAGTVNFMVM